MRETARRAFVAALVVVAVVAGALALWQLRVLIALLFLAFVVAAAMRPTVDLLYRYRIPRGIGILLHYALLAGVVALFLWLVVPRAVDQIQQALGTIPTSSSELKTAASHSTGIKHEILTAIQHRLEKLPSGTSVLHPAITVTTKVFEVLIAIVFTLAAAAYWIFERERAMALVLSLAPPRRRRVIRDTWYLIDLKLGAFVRGQLLLIALVGTVLSVAFKIIGLPFWLLLGAFAGIVEIIPVIGPIAAGGLAIGVGFTQSWQAALAAGLVVLIVRLLEDYIVVPRVLGGAVGLTPLTVLVAVSAVTFLFGGFTVLLAIPFAAVITTLVDVILRERNPAEEEVPTVLFPAKDAEGR
jgi:predicted PurR-regulated permease PerM